MQDGEKLNQSEKVEQSENVEIDGQREKGKKEARKRERERERENDITRPFPYFPPAKPHETSQAYGAYL